MTGPAPTRRFVQQLADGDAVEEVYLVVDKQLRANRNGNLFLQLDLRDRTGAIGARLWNAGEPLFRKVENPHLRALADCFLLDEEFTQAFCRAPAGVRNHHAYLGGLLEHVVTLLDAAERILPLYPELDRDLLLAGVFLHDVGKVRELSYQKVFAYSDEGQLIGHLVIGVEMLNEKAARVPDLTGEPFPTELLLRLKHMILSHHGALEFGSPKLPMTPEAIALHHLDNLDAKVHTFVRDIEEDKGANTAWTPFSP